MIEVKIPYPLRRKATSLAKKMPKLRNSISRNKKVVYGCIGELIVSDYFKVNLRNTYDFDLIKKNKKIDVKTKTCSSIPKPEYECSISAANTKQECDYYLFVRVHDDMKTGWILGGISKKNFFKKARFCKEGEIDPKSRIRWRFKADCYNLEISELIPIEKFLKKKV